MLNFNSEKQYAICATEYNKTLVIKLQKQGINLKIFPSVEIIKLELNEESKKCLTQILDFDWLVFPDIYAVDIFIEALETENFDLLDLDLIKICAFGEAVADRLRFSQIHADLIPTNVDSETIINAFENYLTEEFTDLKFLIIQNNQLNEDLKHRGAKIRQIDVYRTGLPNSSETAKLEALLKGGAIDTFLFSGLEESINLQLLFPEVSIVKLLSETEICALETVTYQNLKENGFSPKMTKI